MTVVAEQTGGIEPRELKREALGLFGGRRLTAAIEARLDAALDKAVETPRLTHSAGLIRSGGAAP